MVAQALPPLRRNILFSVLRIVGGFTLLNLFLIAVVYSTGRAPPKLIHMNYDSISAAHQMNEALVALQYPADHEEKSPLEWRSIFEKALLFEQKNVTEPGEGSAVLQLGRIWEQDTQKGLSLNAESARKIHAVLGQIVALNEEGMFRLAQSNLEFARIVLFVSLAVFILGATFSILAADKLSLKLSHPIKKIAESLRNKPDLGQKLRLPEPTSLEFRILTVELREMWKRVSEIDKLNVNLIMRQKLELEIVLGSVEDGILVVDNLERVTLCNDFFARIVGLLPNSSVGQLWTDLPSSHQNYLMLRRVLNSEQKSDHGIEMVVDGQMRQFNARSRPVVRAGEGAFGHIYLLHDSTEGHQRERLKTEMIDWLSHEFKTPLQSLGMAVDLLEAEREKFEGPQRALIDTIADDVLRIRAVAEEFQKVTQSKAQALYVQMQALKLSMLVRQWLRPFGLIARDRNIQLVFTTESEELEVEFDPVKFSWVISNLVSNALRVSPEQGKVEVRVAQAGREVEISVSDDGPGITDNMVQKMFEPFYQGENEQAFNSHQAPSGLFGIGLAIAKNVVEVHGGRITFHNKNPHGALFQVFLPLKNLPSGSEDLV